MENISLYQNLTYVCYAIAAIGLALAIFFYFYFDIPEIFRWKTGRGKKLKMEQISEQNFNTSKIKFNGQSGSTKHSKGRTGSIAAVHIEQPSQEFTAPTDETSLLGQAGETSVLDNSAGETSVLDNSMSETSVLNESPMNQTVPLKQYSNPVQAQPVAADIHFQVTEQTMLIHTDEEVN